MLEIGMVREEWKDVADGYNMEYIPYNNLVLHVFFEKPKEREVKAVSEDSKFKIAFSDFDGVGFFSLKFDDLSWGDVPFSPNLYKERPAFPALEEGDGYTLNILLIDGKKGELVGSRVVKLGEKFSERLREWCEESLKHSVSQSYYEKTVNQVYQKYDSEELERRAFFRWSYPHGEDREWERER